MEYLPTIGLSELRVIERARDADNGALLQILLNKDSPPRIVMRASLKAANGLVQGVVVLEEPEAGVFISAEEIMQGPAIDVTELLNIAIQTPAPKRLAVHYPCDPGAVVRITDVRGSSYISLAINLPNSSSIVGYMRLHDPNVGTIENAPERLAIGKVELKEKVV